MLQRIQTIYFSLVIICLGACCTGLEFFRYVKGNEFYSFSVFGVEKGNQTDLSMYKSVPIYLTIIGLCLFTFMTLMSYKKIRKQLKWARSLFFIYLLMVIAFLIYSALGKGMYFEDGATQELGLGYLFFIAGLPFSFLALIGVKKDKNLLDSLDRLR